MLHVINGAWKEHTGYECFFMGLNGSTSPSPLFRDSENVRFSTGVSDMLQHLNSPIWWSTHFSPTLNSLLWLTVSSIPSWGYYWNSFVLVEASLLVQEFCFNSAFKTRQQQIRTRNPNLCFKGLDGSEKYFYLHSPHKVCQVKMMNHSTLLYNY